MPWSIPNKTQGMSVISPPLATARQLVSVLAAHYSAAQHLIGGRRGEGLRRLGVETFLAAVASHRKEARPGLIRRILLARSLQRELLAAGYDPQFVRTLMPAVLAELTHSTATR